MMSGRIHAGWGAAAGLVAAALFAAVSWGSAAAVDGPASQAARPADPALAEQVRKELLHAWNGYKQHAWGHDDLLPVSKTWRDWYGSESLLMTAVDTVSTLAIMDLDDEVRSTTDYIAKNLHFDKDINVSNFEITIRILGGLLSAYQSTGDERLLAKADDLATRLLPAFKSKTGGKTRMILRLWVLTLILNLVGGVVLVLVLSVEGALPSGAHEALNRVADEIAHRSLLATLMRGIVGGALIALALAMPAAAGGWASVVDDRALRRIQLDVF